MTVHQLGDMLNDEAIMGLVQQPISLTACFGSLHMLLVISSTLFFKVDSMHFF